MDNDVITTKGRSSRSKVVAAEAEKGLAERKMSMKEQIQANKVFSFSFLWLMFQLSLNCVKIDWPLMILRPTGKIGRNVSFQFWGRIRLTFVAWYLHVLSLSRLVSGHCVCNTTRISIFNTVIPIQILKSPMTGQSTNSSIRNQIRCLLKST